MKTLVVVRASLEHYILRLRRYFQSTLLEPEGQAAQEFDLARVLPIAHDVAAPVQEAGTEGRWVSYLVHAHRSSGDMLKGGFGDLKRTVARDQARKSAVQILGSIPDQLERALRLRESVLDDKRIDVYSLTGSCGRPERTQ
jgi:hypothetical protein